MDDLLLKDIRALHANMQLAVQTSEFWVDPRSKVCADFKLQSGIFGTDPGHDLGPGLSSLRKDQDPILSSLVTPIQTSHLLQRGYWV